MIGVFEMEGTILKHYCCSNRDASDRQAHRGAGRGKQSTGSHQRATCVILYHTYEEVFFMLRVCQRCSRGEGGGGGLRIFFVRTVA